MQLCVWPGNCYEPGNKDEPDLLWDLDLYSRLDLADAWAITGPVNWFGPTSNLKLMFDRLVCMNGGNPREDLIGHKNPELATALEQSPLGGAISRNHLEGRNAAFFSYSDAGADEMDRSGRPWTLQHKSWFDPEQEPIEVMRNAYAPLVSQCRSAASKSRTNSGRMLRQEWDVLTATLSSAEVKQGTNVRPGAVVSLLFEMWLTSTKS